MSIHRLPIRPRLRSLTDDDTTEEDARPWPSSTTGAEDCLVIIYAAERANLARRFVLLPSMGALIVGRDSRNDLVLDGTAVSRRHARLEPRADGWWVTDLCSRNGTYVNYERVDQRRLARGDQVKIGDTIFKFLGGEDVERTYHEEIYRLMILDGLTQAHNARYFAEELDREIARARRHERPLSLVLFDLDHFKSVNDTYGHVTGDHVLREIAALVRGRIRRDELFARYGGEEFAIVLPETRVAGARALAAQLCELIRRHPFEFEGTTVPVSISCGVAELDLETMHRAEDLVDRADRNLYEAKRCGRDRVGG